MAHRYAITHVTRFTYNEPVSESVMEVRMRPLTSDQQLALQFTIDVEPQAPTFVYQDFLGNWVHHFNVPGRHRELVITARAQVDILGSVPVPDTLDLDTWSEVDRWAEGAIHWEFRQPSQLTRGGARLQEFIRSLDIDSRSRDPLSMVRHVMSAIVEQFEYAPQSTGVDTPVDHVIEIRRGVCQDFSHIMIATLRSVGLPARYMSGYLAPSEAALPGPTSIATHAWVEVCLPQLGWVGVDPTHNTVTGTRHVRVAIGRDYADVPPTRGVFKGRAAGALHVSVNIASAERPDGDPEQGETRPQSPGWSVARPDEAPAVPLQQQQQQ